MPYIAGGGDAQVTSLRELLLKVKADGGAPETVNLVDRSRPRGFVERAGRGRWKVTEAGEQWLVSDDSTFLIGVFHSQIRFVGELLDLLRSSGQLTHTQLVELAKVEYDLTWNSPDQVRRRTTWLRASGFIDLRFDNYLVLNPEGEELLGKLEIRPPNSLTNLSDVVPQRVVLPGAPPRIEGLLAHLDASSLSNRKRLIGFMPGGNTGIDALKQMVTAAVPRISREDWAKNCEQSFGLAATSAYQALGSFRGAGLLQQIDREVDSATAEAEEWLESDTDVDLIRLLHCHIRFFGEILALFDQSESSSEVASRALEYSIPAYDLYRRIGLLQAAGLIEESGIRRFRVTPKGQALAEELPLEQSVAPIGHGEDIPPVSATIPVAGAEGGDDQPRLRLGRLEQELKEAARASQDHKRLELAVADALAAIGFSVEHLGGSGRTDVRAQSLLPGKNRFVVIVDAKASAKGQVAPFDVTSLREHKEQHDADYVAAVGEAFPDKRTNDRARSEGVCLITIDQMISIVKAMTSGAFGVSELRALLSHKGPLPDSALSSDLERGKRDQKFVQLILAALAVEAAGDDEVTKGALSPSDIYMQLRNQTESPTLNQIQSVLDLLSSPLVRAVWHERDKYALIEHVNVVAGRLRSLAARVGEANTSSE